MCFFNLDPQRAKFTGGDMPKKKPTSGQKMHSGDVVRATDFNFLTVLGKGSFGKVGINLACFITRVGLFGDFCCVEVLFLPGLKFYFFKGHPILMPKANVLKGTKANTWLRIQ